MEDIDKNKVVPITDTDRNYKEVVLEKQRIVHGNVIAPLFGNIKLMEMATRKNVSTREQKW